MCSHLCRNQHTSSIMLHNGINCIIIVQSVLPIVNIWTWCINKKVQSKMLMETWVFLKEHKLFYSSVAPPSGKRAQFNEILVNQ